TNPGVAWNGLVSASGENDGLEEKVSFYDGQKYYNLDKTASYSGSVEAYTYPDELLEYDGYRDHATRQPRKTFGLSYRANVGGTGDYELHIIYNVLLSPSSRESRTLTDDPELSLFSWDFTTSPTLVPGAKAASHVVINT